MTKKKVVGLVFICVVCALFLLAHRADRANRNKPIGTAPTARETLIGTWKEENGGLFQFRDDGTGRSRNSTKTNSTVHYFEWEAEGSKFTIVYAPQGRLKSFVARALGVETVHFSIEEMSPDGFTLVDTPSGSETRFEQSQDSQLDRAP